MTHDRAAKELSERMSNQKVEGNDGPGFRHVRCPKMLWEDLVRLVEGLKVEEGRVTDELQPTYFVKHPDGSFSIANPQPKAIIPKFSTYEVWTESLPKCVGYEGKCDGDLVGELHEPHCPMHGKEFATLRDAFNAGAGR